MAAIGHSSITMMKPFASSLIPLLLCFSITVHAEEPLPDYDVEVIIFEDSHARYLQSEDWKASTEIIEQKYLQEEAGQRSASSKNRGIYSNIPSTTLAQQAKRLNNSSEFNILYQAAWRQQGLDKDQAFDIDLKELRNLHRSKSDNSIDGSFRVELARYLHFHGDLYYRRPLPVDSETEANEAPVNDMAASQLPPGKYNTQKNETEVSFTEVPGYQTFPMHVHRRMRSKELHYIDHPLVGILVEITPVETPEN
jgi:hypothetical protein